MDLLIKKHTYNKELKFLPKRIKSELPRIGLLKINMQHLFFLLTMTKLDSFNSLFNINDFSHLFRMLTTLITTKNVCEIAMCIL